MAEYVVAVVSLDKRTMNRPWTYDEMMCRLAHTTDLTEYGSVAKEMEFVRNQQDEIERLTKLCVKAYDLGYEDGLKGAGKNG